MSKRKKKNKRPNTQLAFANVEAASAQKGGSGAPAREGKPAKGEPKAAASAHNSAPSNTPAPQAAEPKAAATAHKAAPSSAPAPKQAALAHKAAPSSAAAPKAAPGSGAPQATSPKAAAAKSAAPAGPAESGPEDVPMAAANGGARVPTLATTQLANTKDGNWKVLANGTRVELTDAQWRQELAHLFSKGSAAGKPPTPTS